MKYPRDSRALVDITALPGRLLPYDCLDCTITGADMSRIFRQKCKNFPRAPDGDRSGLGCAIFHAFDFALLFPTLRGNKNLIARPDFEGCKIPKGRAADTHFGKGVNFVTGDYPAGERMDHHKQIPQAPGE